MSSNDEYLDEVYQRFNDAIMNAIVSSDEVRALLDEIGEKGYINESSVFNLFLSLEELESYLNPEAAESRKESAAPAPASESTVAPPETSESETATQEPSELVDGKKLSDREREFLKYCARKFNEKAWLEKARLKL